MSVFLFKPKSVGRRSRGSRRILTASPAPVLGCELASGQGVRASLRLAEREPVTDLFVTRKVNLLLTSFGGKDTQRNRLFQMFSEHSGNGGSGRISKSPVVTCPARVFADEGERSATTSGALARLCRPCPEDTRWHRCRPSTVWTPRQWTRRAAAIDLGENWRGVLVKGEDAGRLLSRLQLCWTGQTSGALAWVVGCRHTPLPGRQEGRGRWTEAVRYSFISSSFSLSSSWNTHVVFLYSQSK